MAARGSSIAYYIFGRLFYQEPGDKTNSTAITVMIPFSTSWTRGLEALTRMLFFKFSVIIIGFCVKSEVQ